jgi:heme/copper-type cytochrome/quinol oxidase subunit 2
VQSEGIAIDRSATMKAWIDLFSTDYGLMSLAVILFVIVMAIYFLRVFLGLMDETGKSTD